MMYINRSGKTPPQVWLDRADVITNSLLAATSEGARNLIIDTNQNLWGELKDFLFDISFQKCWYSESRDTYSHPHVDHFRPKKAALGIDRTDKGGYWWLAFQWTNYRVCGGAGNVRKKDKFAVKSGKAIDHTSNLEDEIIYLLDPTEEEDTLKLTFNSNGEAMAYKRTGWDSERATYTIDTLNLNFKRLKEARKMLWITCSTLIAETQQLMDQNDINPSTYRRGQIKEKLTRLKEIANKQSEFSGTVKACLRSTGIEWAISYAA